MTSESSAPIPPDQGRPRRLWPGVLLWLAGALVAVGIGVEYWRRQPPRATPADGNTSEDRPGGRAAAKGFVGIDACRECHAERVTEFLGTRHYLACRPPDPDVMPVGFSPGRGSFATSRDAGVRFEMSRQGDAFLQTTIRTTPAGEQQLTSQVDLVYGMGAGTDEVYFTWHGNELYELPVVWLNPLDDWGASPFARDQGTDAGRPLTTQCVECHNTWFDYQAGTKNVYNRDECLLGVTCERCHGPGHDHVDFHHAHPGESDGQKIVHPAKLSRERQLDLCGQCHTNAITYRQAPFSYRPGEPLDDYFRVLVTRNPEDDHVANQIRYMCESRCFLESDTLTCTTCHDPHRPRTDNRVSVLREACVNCHEVEQCGERPRLPVAVQDECVSCHMPKRGKVQVSFQTRTSPFYYPVQRCEHRVAVYPDARDRVLRDWYASQSDPASLAEVDRLNHALADYWRAQGEDLRRQYRFVLASDAFQEALKFDPSDELRRQADETKELQSRLEVGWSTAERLRAENRLPAAIEQLEQLLAIKPDFALAHNELGTLYAMAGQRANADEHLRAAAQYDPDSPSAPAMLGWLSYLDGRPAEALEQYRIAEAVEPYNARIHFNMGLALSQLKKWDDAADQFRKVVEIDPQDAAGWQGLSEAARELGDVSESLSAGQQAVTVSSGRDASTLLTLAAAHAAAGHTADAERFAQQALARNRDQSKAPQIREFLRQLRSALPAANDSTP